MAGTFDKGQDQLSAMGSDGKVMLLGVVLLAAGLAGCIGQDGTDDAEADPTACDGCDQDDALDTTSAPEGTPGILLATAWTNASVTGVGTGAGLAYVCSPQDCENVHTFDLSPNATGLVLEAIWESSTTLYMAAEVPDDHCSPDGTGLFLECPDPDPVTGQSPLRLEITDPETLSYTGGWTVRVWVDSPTPESAEPTIWSTAAHGGPLPDGFTHAQG